MYMETSIIRDNKIISDFNFSPNKDLDIYLRSHERGKGDDQWFAIANLTKNDIDIIKKYIQSEDEKKYLSNLKEGDTIDILLHYCICING